jgi:AraC-like DNA-binding protein/quercetin dioxygenase-like cupin family protein
MRARFEKVADDPQRSFQVREWRLERFDAPWHFHPEIELTLIVEGSGRRFVGDRIEPFEAGDLVLLGAGLPHFWQSGGQASARSVVVQFRSDFLGAAVWEQPEFQRVRNLIARSGRGLHFTGATAREVADGMMTLPALTGMAGLALLLALLDRLAGARRSRPLASAGYAPALNRQAEERISRVYAYAAEHFRDEVALADLARAAAMSPASFSRYFKRTTGRAPSDFLNDLRVEQACRQLRESDHTVTRIATDAGFATVTNFNRRFRERMGTTPREYRLTFVETPAPVRFSAAGSPRR